MPKQQWDPGRANLSAGSLEAQFCTSNVAT
ncbi:hypothetical protein CLV01_3367 [Delftia sp. 60]|nr:hypothetical protein CLU98_3082 [Burkholderiales bacterium 23]PIF66965.1 hypothetical protein CLV01_3367 [Delftia sp. 60]